MPRLHEYPAAYRSTEEVAVAHTEMRRCCLGALSVVSTVRRRPYNAHSCSKIVLFLEDRGRIET